MKHRTGHGIDTQCHGSGVNIDSWEFPDPRPSLEGSCFSLEPGIYFPDFGMRTEVNVYINKGRAIISQGDRRQFSLLCCHSGRKQ
jgi:Xaa-Pro aminopeptidase